MTTVDKHKPAHYRPDIDGLRAIAVLMVLGSHLSHASTGRMSGGYIGVDVFFVISGYLITGGVLRDLAKERFSLAGFYERRIRRIIPALLAVLAATTVGVFLLFPPAQLVSYSYSLLAALFSYANFYFATQAGYFAPSYTQVLQHTWSLGVEEQFYVLLPVCLMLLSKWRGRNIKWFLGVFWLLSFACSCVLVFRDRNATFYMPYTRAWELLSGSLLALGVLPAIHRRWMRELLAALSLSVLAACMIGYSSSTVFPGPNALVVCLAAVLLLKVGETGETLVTRPLRSKPATFIGLISYSLYLWHWPILVFLHLGIWRGWTGKEGWQRAPIALVCIGIAYLSWRYVEQPFRTGRWKRLTRNQIFAWAGAAGLLVATVAITFIVDHGVASRFSPRAIELSSYLGAPAQMNSGVCFYGDASEPIQAARCLTPVAGKKNVLLLGDSHAAMYWYALKRGLPGVNLMQLNGGGCAPYAGNRESANCARLDKFLFEQYLPTATPDEVVLSIRWHDLTEAEKMQPLLQQFTAMHVPVYIIGPSPEYEGPLPLLLALGIKWHRPALARSADVSQASADSKLAQYYANRPGITYLSAYNQLCPADVCREYADDARTVPTLTDDNHLSNEASLELVRKWVADGSLPQ
jgi:peptidoglycan/LPS O-acetylase OafA/YrhL